MGPAVKLVQSGRMACVGLAEEVERYKLDLMLDADDVPYL